MSHAGVVAGDNESRFVTWGHERVLAEAIEACRTRMYFSPFPDRPGGDDESLQAIDAGRAAFEEHLGSSFELNQPTSAVVSGGEISPYTLDPLQIDYPTAEIDELYGGARRAAGPLRRATPTDRVELCLEIVRRLHERWFELAFATMHTTGQSFAMSCVGSGTNALDRGIEAVAYASEAMDRVPRTVRWEKPFGEKVVRLDKRYEIIPRGTAAVVACASFPTWNAYPAILANLATGNPVIVKPHPTSVLTMALAVRTCQTALQDAGLPPEAVQLAVDTVESPVTVPLVQHPDCRIVDFTGSPGFGAWIQANTPGAITFTETAGVNAVLLESVESLDLVARAMAGSLCLFSAQMCTSAQNIYLSASGVRTASGNAGVDDVVDALLSALSAVADNPQRAASVLGAIQAPSTLDLVASIEKQAGLQGEVVREATDYGHPQFPSTRTCAPMIAKVDPGARDLFGEERFGPVSFVVICEDADDALEQAVHDVRRRGTIASHLYSIDSAFLERATDAFFSGGASVSRNLTGPMPLNYAAAYSDYHVTGLSPAGNACLTDEAFIAGRFRIVQSREPIADEGVSG